METRQYLGILWRRKWIILVTTLAAVGVAVLGSSLQQPVFSASATIRVAQASRGSIQYVDYMYAERLMNTYRDLLQSRPFLASVIERLSLPTSVEALSKQVKVDVVLDTELLKITAENTDPARAQRVANTLAVLFVEQSRSLYSGTGESVLELLHTQLDSVDADLKQNRVALEALRSNPNPDQRQIEDLAAKVATGEGIYASLLRQYEDMRLTEASRASSVSLAEPAFVPEKPIRPRKTLNFVLGMLVGLLSGIGLAFLFESLDPALHSRRDLEAASDLPILASIPDFKTLRGTPKGVIPVDGRAYSPADEAFGILREAILSAPSDSPIRTLLIASPEPGAGKSTVLSNLAVAIARAGRRVIVVDADFRRPVLHEAFGLRNDAGLTTAIQGISDVSTVLQNTDIAGIRVLTSGPPIPDTMQLLGSSKLTSLFNQLLGEADVILVDSPPILTVADASHLAPKVDGVLVVAAREQATAEGIRRAVLQLRRLGARVVGLVYNKAQVSDDYYYAYAYTGRRRKAPRKGALQAPSVRVGAGDPRGSRQREDGRDHGLRSWLSPGVIVLIAVIGVYVSLIVLGAAGTVLDFSRSIASLVGPCPTAIQTDQPTVRAPSPEPAHTPEASQLSQGTSAFQQREAGGMPAGMASALTASESRPVISPTLSLAPTQDSLRSGAPPSRLALPTSTMVPQVESGLPGQIIPGLTLPAKGVIAYSSNSGLSGAFVLKSPRLWTPEAIWLPNGWQVDILSAETWIRPSGSTEWWYHVRPVSFREAYAGYVLASAVLVQR